MVCCSNLVLFLLSQDFDARQQWKQRLASQHFNFFLRFKKCIEVAYKQSINNPVAKKLLALYAV